MAQRYLTAVSYGKSLLWLFAFWALAPLLVWFAVFLAKRKSGWGICGSSWLVCGCFCRFVMICLTTLDQVCPCTNVFENVFENCLFSCKDRASERRRPYQRKKKPSSMHCKLCPKQVWLSASSVKGSMLVWERCTRGVCQRFCLNLIALLHCSCLLGRIFRREAGMWRFVWHG